MWLCKQGSTFTSTSYLYLKIDKITDHLSLILVHAWAWCSALCAAEDRTRCTSTTCDHFCALAQHCTPLPEKHFYPPRLAPVLKLNFWATKFRAARAG